jgi:hypothetical protein
VSTPITARYNFPYYATAELAIAAGVTPPAFNPAFPVKGWSDPASTTNPFGSSTYPTTYDSVNGEAYPNLSVPNEFSGYNLPNSSQNKAGLPQWPIPYTLQPGETISITPFGATVNSAGSQSAIQNAAQSLYNLAGSVNAAIDAILLCAGVK